MIPTWVPVQGVIAASDGTGPYVLKDDIVGMLEGKIEAWNGLIDKGKGTWPNANYVRDEVWTSWRSERRALEDVLRRFRASD